MVDFQLLDPDCRTSEGARKQVRQGYWRESGYGDALQNLTWRWMEAKWEMLIDWEKKRKLEDWRSLGRRGAVIIGTERYKILVEEWNTWHLAFWGKNDNDYAEEMVKIVCKRNWVGSWISIWKWNVLRYLCCVFYQDTGASQVAPVVKNPPANSDDTRDAGLIPEMGRSPGVWNGNRCK